MNDIINKLKNGEELSEKEIKNWYMRAILLTR